MCSDRENLRTGCLSLTRRVDGRSDIAIKYTPQHTTGLNSYYYYYFNFTTTLPQPLQKQCHFNLTMTFRTKTHLKYAYYIV